MTGHLKARFAGGEFECMDDVPEGTLVDVVVRPEDVIITRPEDGIITGRVTSVIFKGIHYEIAVESGKYEMVIQSIKSAKVGDTIGMSLEPEGIHIMIAEDHTTRFEAEVGDDLNLVYSDRTIPCDVTKVFPGSRIKDGELFDASGEKIDTSEIKVLVSIQPGDIQLSDDVEAGLTSGKIINLIYKGDHYSYVVRTIHGHDLIVDDEYLWNMDDMVGLVMPEDKMTFSVKK